MVVSVSPPLLNLSDATDTVPEVGAADTSSANTPVDTTFSPPRHIFPAGPATVSNPTAERPLGTPHRRQSEREKEIKLLLPRGLLAGLVVKDLPLSPPAAAAVMARGVVTRQQGTGV